MRIAMISTIYHATPPKGYGGIERVVHRLTEQLIKEGHDVTLFGTPGSSCSGQTIEIAAYDPDHAPSGIRKGSDILDEEPLYDAMVQHFLSHPVDVIHDFSFQNLYVTRHAQKIPFVISTCIPPTKGYQRQNLVACSQAHATLCGAKTKFVHYGLDLDHWPYNINKTSPMVHISKITSYKGQHQAIAAARAADTNLEIAGNIENRVYYVTKVLPQLWFNAKARYVGELKGTQTYLQSAKALVQTPLWFDAFPLVVLEALASATPVIGYAQGGIPEQIVHGQTGFLCQNQMDLAEAMRNIETINPGACRKYAEEHFSLKRMAADYLRLYQAVQSGETW